MISLNETLEILYIEPQRKREREMNLEKSKGSESVFENKENKYRTDVRPDWDSWFMTLCFIIAQRSLDKHTKHGCIIVGDAHEILSVGYNSPPRGCMDKNIPLERPQKYLFMEHSESNAINNAARCGIMIKKSTFYITGPPCHECFRKIINVGAKAIVCGPILHQRDDEAIEAIKIMNCKEKENFSDGVETIVEVRQFLEMPNVLAILDQTKQYIHSKKGDI